VATYAANFFDASEVLDFPMPGQPSQNAATLEDSNHVLDFPMPAQPSMLTVSIVPNEGGGGAALVYRMRGFDQNVAVNDTVFWDSDHVDATAADYTGSAGPVINIVLQKKIGAE
jgi:hypothetical protein